MRREDKKVIIDSLTEQLNDNNNFYLTDISELDAEQTQKLRALCFKHNISMTVVKNTLLRKAMDATEKELEGLYEVLVGNTSIMFAEAGNAPAKMIKEFRKGSDRPILKGAYIEEMSYVGDDQLDFLTSIKSKNELIADVVALLKSPLNNVMSALNAGGKVHSLLQALEEREQ